MLATRMVPQAKLADVIMKLVTSAQMALRLVSPATQVRDTMVS